MGRGDKKTRKGKISKGSFGVLRPHKKKTEVVTAKPKTKKAAAKKEPVAKDDAKKSTPKKAATAKKAPTKKKEE